MFDDNRITQSVQKENGKKTGNDLIKRFYSEDTLKNAGEILIDRTSTGRDRGWAKKRSNASKLAESYKRIGKLKKSEKVDSCTTDLLFKECPSGHEKNLIGTYTCKVRLCPVCSWRRSLVVYHQAKTILHEANKRENYEYLFLTLTVKNCVGEELKQEIDNLMKGWDRLAKRTIFKKSIKGWFRALEITRNKENDTYHPHFHVILAVSPRYFKDKDKYIKHEDWRKLWKESMRLDYDPQVNIKKSKPNKTKKGEQQKPIENLVAEGAKYATKSTDYIVADTQEMDKAVEILDNALHKRRLIAFGGIFKEIQEELRLQTEEQADLINIDEQRNNACKCKTCGSTLIDHLYKWTENMKQYIG